MDALEIVKAELARQHHTAEFRTAFAEVVDGIAKREREITRLERALAKLKRLAP